MSCPVCQKKMVQDYRPFCSKRCADVDLGRWFNGGYAIPAEDALSGEGDETENAEAPVLRH